MNEYNKIVIKVGTSSITNSNGTLNFKQIDKLAQVIADLSNKGLEIVLVSSGAITAGVARLNLPERPKEVSQKQAVACVGQQALMHIYNKTFAEYGFNVGQLLLTKYVFDHEEASQNAKHTIENLLKMHVVPIINENDSITTDEIKLGDNDNLSSLVARLINADLLIMLSDIDGLYDKNPKMCADAKIIRKVESLSDDFLQTQSQSAGTFGTGGIITKIQAGCACSNAGIDAVLASSQNLDVIFDIVNGKEVGTLFSKKVSK